MTRFVMPIILIVLAVSVFVVFTDPFYNDINSLKTTIATYNSALDNSKALGDERDTLTAKEGKMNENDLAGLDKFLPDSVDNIRLILEIGQIAAPYGMVLKDVKYDATTDTSTGTTTATTGTVVQGGGVVQSTPKDYGTFNLEFSTSGSYSNFINFTKNLESNLRIVDISSISFSSDSTTTTTVVGTGAKAASPDIYTYDFKIKTYWLKN